MRKIYFLLSILLTSYGLFGQTPVPMASQPGLIYTENFADIANWTNGFASGIGANRFAPVAVNATGTIPDGVRITAATSSFTTGTSGGVQKGTQNIVLLSTGATDNTSADAIDFGMDFTGVNAGTLSFDWASVNNSTGDRKGSLRIYYSTDGTGFTELTAAQVLNFTNNTPTSGTVTNVALPAAFNNSATARLRFYYYNGTGGTTGSRPKISIDNLTVTAASTVINTVSVAAGANAAEPGTTGSFTINFSTPTISNTDIDFNFAGTAAFGTDYTVSYSPGSTPSVTSSGTLTVPAGTAAVTITITPVNDLSVESTETISLTLSSPTAGYVIGSGNALINLTDDDVPPAAAVAAGTNAAEPATNGTFTVTLSSAAPAGGVTINYTLGGTAALNTDYSDPQSGSITIAEGNSSGTITLNVIDDPAFEPAETISITLNSATNGYVIGTASAIINLTSDDASPGILLSSTYAQDFNTLASTGTSIPWSDNFTINGWYASRVVYNTGNGGSNAGALYSFGATAAADRALGAVGSGSTGTVFYGARFKNTTGTAITSLKITYTGEEWRNGGANAAQTVNFAYQTGATVTSLTAGTWTPVTNLNFTSPVFSATAAALDGNLVGTNATVISYTINGLNIANNDEIMIRWEDIDHSGSDHGLAIDDFTIEANPADLTAPLVVSLSPANNATGVSTNTAASITFDETIQKGAGNIVLKKTSDNSVIQTIDITTPAVALSTTTATFSLAGLDASTGYYIEIDNGAFKDISGNSFAGISGSSIWGFTTGNNFYAADFNTCSSVLTDGFTQFSSTGAITWACTTFGRDPAAPAGTAPFPYGIQINGFSGGTNVPNIDWLISPSFNLTSTTYPLLSFWSRTAFNGLPLQLKVSTDYTSGDPALATWTDINGKFPAQTSNSWTLSENINLEAFRQPSVHFAFVYTSTNDDGARWTIDDISLINSLVPPPPSLTVNTAGIQFTYVASGSTADKTFTFTGNDLIDDVTLTATGNFQLSKNGSSFSSSITYTAAEANNVLETLYVRFAPNQAGQNFTGTVTVNTSTLSSVVNLVGTSIDPATTLEVVNWNMEWFGSTEAGLGPDDKNQQEQNAKTILQNIGADAYCLVEVVDEARLAHIVSQMPGYSYVICNFGSHANPFESNPSTVSAAQKEAFVYKTALFSNITSMPLLTNAVNTATDLSNPDYSYWSSGRYPFMVSTDVTLNCVTKNIKFIIVHAKANTSPTNTSYDRRKSGADDLHTLLNGTYANDNIVILGDFNDDLDQSITAGFTTTSWSSFTTDAPNFTALTLPLSLAGKKSTVSYNDVIDHVVVSNELQPYYMPATANILTDVASLVSNYGKTTSDHYPVFTRYKFEQPAPPVINCPGDIVKNNDAGICGAIVNYTVTYSGNCGTATLIQRSGLPSGTVFPAGTTENTYVVIDAAGDSAVCSFKVIVTDTENPTITCPGNITASSTAGCGTTVNYTVTYADNCTGATLQQTAGLPSGATFPNGTTTNTFVVTDASGNTATCSFTVTVTDAQPPVISCPANITANTDAGACGATVTYSLTANDNCGAVTVQQTAGLPSGAVFPAGTTTNTFVATDAAGNTATCSFTITITDHEAPTFTKPADKVIAFSGGTCSYNASPAITGDVTNEHDNCTTGIQAAYTDQVTSCGNIVTINRTWTLSDNNGNQAPPQVQVITVTDNDTRYVVYAKHYADFGEYNTINGSVGVSSPLGETSFRKGSVLLSPDFAKARFISVAAGATVQSRITTPATDGPNPPFYNFSGITLFLPSRTISASTAVPVSANYRQLVIKRNVTVTITGTLYGEIDIEQGAHVTFAPAGGVVNIETLEIDGKNTVNTSIQFASCTSVRVGNKVHIDENVQVNVGGPKVTFYMGDNFILDEEKFIVEGGRNSITANIYIPNGKLKVDGGNNGTTTMTGWFIVEKMESTGKNIVWNNNNCTSPAAVSIFARSVVNEKEIPASETTVDQLTITASPNPSATDFTLHIESNDRQTALTLRITDVSGRTISMQAGIAPHTTVKTGAALKNGIYFAEVMQGKEKRVVKLVKL